ncbi:MAG TPA: hypothetical protein VJR89_04235, partial [Polyangiales bacterium]|nr:hypothetical protein [Polyangiales bacterium]
VRDLQQRNTRLRALAARLDLGALPREIPRKVRVMSAAILAAPWAAKLYLRKLPNRVLAGAILRAALVPIGDDFRYSYADERARHIIALGCIQYALRGSTRRTDRWAGGMVSGFTEGALRMLLADPHDATRVPSRSALVGTHRPGGNWENGQCGWLLALEQCGALYRQQLPASDASVRPWERWPSGYTSNRYWLVTDRTEAPRDPAMVTLLRKLQAFAGELLDGAGRAVVALTRAMRRAASIGPPATAQPP